MIAREEVTGNNGVGLVVRLRRQRDRLLEVDDLRIEHRASDTGKTAA